MPTRTRTKMRYARWQRARSRSGQISFRKLIEGVPLAVCRTTPEGAIQEANAALAHLLGFPDRASLLNLNIQNLYRSPSDRASLLSGIEPGGTARRNGVVLCRQDGSPLYVDNYIRLLSDPRGRLLGYEDCFIDVSESRNVEDTLARQMSQLNALHMVSQEMVTAHDVDRIYQAAFEAAAQFVPVDAFMIALIDEARGEAEDAFVFDRGRRWPNERSPIAERTMLSRVLETGQPLFIDDVPPEAAPGGRGHRFGDHSDTTPTRSILAAPLTVNGRAIGMITAQHYQPHMYNEEHVQAMVILANQVAIVIEHARLVDSLRLRVAALNAAANTIVITDRLGQVEWANPALTRLTGYSLEEVHGRNVGRLLRSGRQDEAFYQNLWETITSGRPWQGQIVNRRKNGVLYTEEMTITPVQDAQGEIRHFIAIKQDITNRQRAEMALRESEEKYRTVVEQAEDGICIVQNGVIRFANQRMAAMNGGQIHELVGSVIQDFIDESDRVRLMDIYARHMRGEEVPLAYEANLVRLDGVRLEAEISVAFITYLGDPAELVIVRDITERKQTEQVMQRRYREMVALNDISAAGVRATDVDELIRTVTRRIRESLYPEDCGVLLVDEEHAAWTPHSSYEGMSDGKTDLPHPLAGSLIGSALKAGKAVRGSGPCSEICAPLRVNGQAFGCLKVSSCSPDAFSEHDERLVTTLADSLSIAIEKIHLLKMEQQRRAEAAAITEVGRGISASLDLDTVLQSIASYAGDLLHAESCAVYMADPEGSIMRAVAGVGSDIEALKKDPLRVGRGILGNIAGQKFGEIVNDVDADPRSILVPGTQENAEEHLMGVPVLIKGSLISLIAVWRIGKGLDFKPAELEFLNSLAQQAGMAIENARLFNETQKRLREMEGMVQVSTSLSRTLELEPLLEEILRAAIHAIPSAERGSILLADESRNLHVRAVWGYSDPRIRGLVFPQGFGYSARAFLQSHGVLVRDIQHDPEAAIPGEVVESFDRGSAIAAPLIVKDRAIGVIAIDTPHSENAFDENDLNLLQAMAAPAALGIENARLFESTRQRLSEIQAVHTVSTALRSAQTLGQALPIILEQLMEIMGSRGASLEMVNPLNGEIVNELAFGEWAAVTGIRSEPGSGISGRVMETGRPYVTTDVVTDGLAVRPDLFGELKVVACVPVISQHQPIGTLWVGRTTPFTEDEVSLLSAIGEMVGNALHRMRLNEQTEHRADQLASLRTIDQAISASLDLNLTLNILLDQVIGHLKVHAADILLLDRTTRRLVPAAARGFRASDMESFHRRLGGGLGPRVARERRILQVPDLAKYSDQIRGFLLIMDEGFVSYIGIPLVAKEQLVGVLECFHRAPLQVDADWLGFLEALSGQAAIAIDKARLLEDLQESNQELTRAYDITLEGWARALELRDKETEGHSRRVTEMTLELARSLNLPSSELIHLRRGVLLHDIGKMGVADSILRKTGPLNEEELTEMRRHPRYAYDLIYPIVYLRPALDIPYCHHEKWDGTGYPQGLRTTQIPLPARIFAVIDVWDALTHDRPYRGAWTKEQALAYIREQSGVHFDPMVVEAFMKIVDD